MVSLKEPCYHAKFEFMHAEPFEYATESYVVAYLIRFMPFVLVHSSIFSVTYFPFPDFRCLKSNSKSLSILVLLCNLYPKSG